MTTVLATGTFDILHPGHLHYLRESALEGDELVVILARESVISHKRPPILPVEQRRAMVAALDPVDEAVVGSEESIFEPLYEIEPDVVTLGHDQNYAVEDLEDELRERGFDAEVVRVDARAEDDMVVSTSAIVERILERRG